MSTRKTRPDPEEKAAIEAELLTKLSREQLIDLVRLLPYDEIAAHASGLRDYGGPYGRGPLDIRPSTRIEALAEYVALTARWSLAARLETILEAQRLVLATKTALGATLEFLTKHELKTFQKAIKPEVVQMLTGEGTVFDEPGSDPERDL
jgi:hypothetical protein